MSRLLELLLAAAVGALAFYALGPSAEPVIYREVVVPTRAIVEREPPPRPPRIVERIRFISPPAFQIATAPGGGADDVADFCRPTILALTDTVEAPAPDPVLLLRSGVHTRASWWHPFDRGELLLTGPTSYGELKAFDFPVRPGFDFRARGDSVLVRYPRGAALRDFIDWGARAYTVVHLLTRLIPEE